jgi:hypothetical protein
MILILLSLIYFYLKEKIYNKIGHSPEKRKIMEKFYTGHVVPLNKANDTATRARDKMFARTQYMGRAGGRL